MPTKIKKNKVTLPSINREPEKKLSRFSKAYIIGAGIILVTLFALYYFKGLFIAATVNGQPISRFSVISSLEKQSGKQTLESMIVKTLILQEAKKQNITISKSDLDQEIKKIEAQVSSQGQNLDQLLLAQGMSRNDLMEQIEIQKTAEKLVEKDIKITDKEVEKYIEENKGSLKKKDAKLQLRQQKINEKLQSLIQGLQAKAKINHFVSY